LVGMVSYRNLPVWIKRFEMVPPVFLSEWAAMQDLPFGQENPYERKLNIIFTGCMVPRYVDRINDLAAGFDGDIWIVALFNAFRRSQPGVLKPSRADSLPSITGFGLTNEGRRELFRYPNIKFVSDIRPASLEGPSIYGTGPVFYGNFWDFLEHADIALGFTLLSGMRNCHIKVWDYLAYGIPIVHERGSPMSRLITPERGMLVAWDSILAIRKGVDQALSKSFDRHETVKWVQENHTWDHRAREWDERIGKLI